MPRKRQADEICSAKYVENENCADILNKKLLEKAWSPFLY